MINTSEKLTDALDAIAVFGSLGWGWEFHIESVFGSGTGWGNGWLVWATFNRPDIDTGNTGVGRTRREFVPIGSTRDAVAKTVFVLLKLTVEHELMESFHVGGARVFNPHHTVDELARIRSQN